MMKTLYRRAEVEQIIVMLRLGLYNRAAPCGASAIRRRRLAQLGLQPLPSESTIKRILPKYGLTHARTGFYP